LLYLGGAGRARGRAMRLGAFSALPKNKKTKKTKKQKKDVRRFGKQRGLAGRRTQYI
jgi:hypothetical protein